MTNPEMSEADVDESTSKKCTKCEQVKPLTDFCRDRQKKDGLAFWCRPCKSGATVEYQRTPAGRLTSKERAARYHAAHPERAAERGRRWREKNPTYAADRNREWREKNPGAAAAYYLAHKEETMARVLKRRGHITDTRDGRISFKALWEMQEGTCGICAELIDHTLPWPDPRSASIDHIVPLSKGGAHKQSNLQYAHFSCNLAKRDKLP